MKKALSLVFSFVFMFAIAGVAHADVASVVCDYPNHAIWNNDNSAKIGCIASADWDKAVASQVRTDTTTIHVARGQRLLTTYGFEDSCPDWFPPAGCVIQKALFVKWL